MISFPATPDIGDIYTYADRTWLWNGNAWQSSIYKPDGAIAQDAPPANPSNGWMWWDRVNSRLFTWNGAAWVEPNTNYPVGDPDVWNYVLQVEGMDGQPLETGVVAAIGNFVYGCKADGTWDAIKSACLLAGARTLAGALIPLKGIAPTNVNFMASDYDRETGLKGDGSGKYLSSNRANNADPQNSHHQSVWVSEHSAGTASYINAGNTATGSTSIVKTATSYTPRSRNSSADTVSFSNFLPGLVALSRNNSANYTLRYQGNEALRTRTSQVPTTAVAEVFRSPNATNYADARLAFYSIGEAINMSQLDARVSTLLTEIQTAIP